MTDQQYTSPSNEPFNQESYLLPVLGDALSTNHIHLAQLQESVMQNLLYLAGPVQYLRLHQYRTQFSNIVKDKKFNFYEKKILIAFLYQEQVPIQQSQRIFVIIAQSMFLLKTAVSLSIQFNSNQQSDTNEYLYCSRNGVSLKVFFLLCVKLLIFNNQFSSCLSNRLYCFSWFTSNFTMTRKSRHIRHTD